MMIPVAHLDLARFGAASSATPEDYSFVLSGGADNSDPAASLGGDPSAHAVSPVGINNLFPDVTSSQVVAGYTDYRCVYFFNDTSRPLVAAKLSVHSQVAGGAVVQLGVLLEKGTQTIALSGTATGGHVTVTLESSSYQWDYHASADTMATNLTTWLRTVSAGAPTVVALSTQTSVAFLATWTDYRFRPTLAVTGGFTGATAHVTRVHAGSPINAVATAVASGTTAPASVVFKAAAPSDPFVVGDVGAGEGINFWIKRIADVTIDPLDSDGCVVRVSGTRG